MNRCLNCYTNSMENDSKVITHTNLPTNKPNCRKAIAMEYIPVLSFSVVVLAIWANIPPPMPAPMPIIEVMISNRNIYTPMKVISVICTDRSFVSWSYSATTQTEATPYHCLDLDLWLADFKICLKILSGWPWFMWLQYNLSCKML